MSHQTHQSRRRRGPVLVAAGMAAVAAIAAIAAGIALAVPASASASDDYATSARVDDLRFTSETVTSGSAAELSGTWSLPDGPATPAGFVVDLPAALRGRSDGFPLLAPDGSAMGRCTVSATELDCAVDSTYVAAHPNGLHGSFSFWVSVETTTTSATSTTYQVGGTAVTTTVEPAQPGTGSGTCTTGCSFSGRTNGKYGSYDAAAGVVEWVVVIGSGPEGMSGGQRVTVTDTPGPDQELVSSLHGSPFATLWQTDQKTTGGDGREGLTGWAPAPSDLYDSTAGSVSFTTRAGYFYDVHFATEVTDGGLAGRYSNTATITIDGDDAAPVSSTVVHQGGGATGSGTAPATKPTPTPTPTPGPTAPATAAPTGPPTATPTPTQSSTPSTTGTPDRSVPRLPAETGSPTAASVGAAVDTGGAAVGRPVPWWSVACTGAGSLLLLAAIGGLAARTARRRP